MGVCWIGLQIGIPLIEAPFLEGASPDGRFYGLASNQICPSIRWWSTLAYSNHPDRRLNKLSLSQMVPKRLQPKIGFYRIGLAGI